MMVTLFKFIHIAAISIWAGGLVCMPFLYVQRSSVGEDQHLHRMHAMTRFFYVVILSPSAFVAVGSGIALIFLQQTFDAWFSLKLFFVGLLVMVHIVSGLVIIKLFDEAGTYPRWRYVAVTMLTTLVITAILVVVSGKPVIDPGDLYPDFFAPGHLGELLAPFIPWATQ
jgi:protoporphyrinogen IX oxidase